MMIRPYQQAAIETARKSWAAGHRSILMVAPTGAGKTIIFSEIARSAVNRGGRVLVVVHRSELVTQARDKLSRLGLRVGIIQAGIEGDPGAPVQVATTQTLLARATDITPTVVIVDEAHHYPSADTVWGGAVARYTDAAILGFTATPERGDGLGLSQFDELIVVARPRELIESGYLVPVEVYRPSSAGSSLAEEPAEAFVRFSEGNQGIIFPSTIAAGREIVDGLSASGVVAEMITERTRASIRADAIDRFRAGEIRALVGVHVLTEGFDCPDAYIAILASNCSSPGSLIQKCGRVMRPAPGKTHCRVIDLFGATHRHGLPDEDRDYSLVGQGIRSKSDLPPQVTCPTCQRVFRRDHMVDAACPGCGTVIPGRPPPKLRRRALDLATPRRWEYGSGRDGDIQYWISTAIAREWPKGRAAVRARFRHKYGYWPSERTIDAAGGWGDLSWG